MFLPNITPYFLTTMYPLPKWSTAFFSRYMLKTLIQFYTLVDPNFDTAKFLTKSH